MARPKIPASEWHFYEMRQKAAPLAARFYKDDDNFSCQFIMDLDDIFSAIATPDRHVPPPQGEPTDFPLILAPTVPKRLPFGPLRRMARRIGGAGLRYVFAVGSDRGQSFFRLDLRLRLDKEFRDHNHYKENGQKLKLIEFGNAVLEFERAGNFNRGEALKEAANQLGIAASARSHERYFREFREYCERRGYVPSPLDWMGWQPQFALADLEGRGSDKPQK